MTIIRAGDWVLVCETNERGCVIEVFDEGERFLLEVMPNDQWPFPRRVHVMVEKLRKIKPPKPPKFGVKWKQETLF